MERTTRLKNLPTGNCALKQLFSFSFIFGQSKAQTFDLYSTSMKIGIHEPSRWIPFCNYSKKRLVLHQLQPRWRVECFVSLGSHPPLLLLAFLGCMTWDFAVIAGRFLGFLFCVKGRLSSLLYPALLVCWFCLVIDAVISLAKRSDSIASRNFFGHDGL